MPELLRDYLPIVIFMAVAGGITLALMVAPILIAYHAPDPEKLSAYECGFDAFDDAQLRELHRRMFEDVWKWAGLYRTTPRNIGIEAYRIPTEVRQLVRDARYWADNQVYPADECAIRFSHRLVSIHPFPNGNGRHSRIAADILAVRLGRPVFSWGKANLIDAGGTRKEYIAALQAADTEVIEPLLNFARG